MSPMSGLMDPVGERLELDQRFGVDEGWCVLVL